MKEVERNSVTFEWEEPEDDGGSPVTNYIIEKRDAKRTMWSQCEKIDSSETSYTAKNLLEGNEYLFRVIAENAKGKGEPLEMEEPVQPRSPYGTLRAIVRKTPDEIP